MTKTNFMPTVYDQKDPGPYIRPAPDSYGVEYDYLGLAEDSSEAEAPSQVTERSKKRRLVGAIALAAVIAVATIGPKEGGPQTVRPAVDAPPVLVQ